MHASILFLSALPCVMWGIFHPIIKNLLDSKLNKVLKVRVLYLTRNFHMHSFLPYFFFLFFFLRKMQINVVCGRSPSEAVERNITTLAEYYEGLIPSIDQTYKLPLYYHNK